jgi:putative SOS response-associated peptidase YedK
MCTNFSPTRQTEWAAQALGVSWPQGHPEEVFPGQLAPIVLRSHRQERHAAGLARFGLIPTWAKDLGQGRHTYNARSETAAAKPSFRHAWQARQYALLVVDRFYEPCYDTGRAVRWSIAADNSGTPLGLACLWERWVEPETQQIVASFAMLTVNADAHPVLNRFHKPGEEKRSPVLLPLDQWQHWLSASPELAQQMMQAHQAPPLVVQADPLPSRQRATVSAS